MHRILGELPGAVVLAALITYFLRPVSRARLERFARRQSLEITVANGPVIIDYLATTRRWRVGGFVAGLLISFAVGFTQRSHYSGGAGALVGWFAGALLAEWRSESRRPAPARRAALLVARRLSDYLPVYFLVMNLLAWAAAVGLGVAGLATQGSARYSVLVEAGFALVVTPITWLVARRVVARPQPVAPGDVLAADDALRSRSLHVLAGSTLAVNGILAALIESAAQRGYDNWMPANAAMLFDLAAAVVLPLVGFLAATSPFSTRRGLPTLRTGVRA